MKWLSDPTRRFVERPHFLESEIQQRVDAALAMCFVGRAPSFPISDQNLDLIVDSLTSHYDPHADLQSRLGEDVEGVTLFRPGEKAKVKISARLMTESYRRRRRMTIAHEIGHVLLHCDLYTEDRTLDLFSDSAERGRVYCKHSSMLPGVDWLEWQATFAGGCILMPSLAVREALIAFRGAEIDAPLYPDDEDTNKVIGYVSECFDVSCDAARVRLMQTGFVEQHRSIQRLPLW